MVDFGMLSDTFQEQKPSKEEVKKESPPKKVAFKNLDEDKLILKKKMRGESLDSDDSDTGRKVAR